VSKFVRPLHTDITAAKKMFSRSLKSLIETEVIDENSDGNYQYGDDIEPLWSDVKTYVPSKHFK
jgi:hypothetical protein